MKAHDCVPEGKTSAPEAGMALTEDSLFITCFIFRSVLAGKALSHDHAGTQTNQQLHYLKSYKQTDFYLFCHAF